MTKTLNKELTRELPKRFKDYTTNDYAARNDIAYTIPHPEHIDRTTPYQETREKGKQCLPKSSPFRNSGNSR